MRLDKPPQVLPRPLMPLPPRIRLHLAEPLVLLRVLPRLVRQVVHRGVPRREHGYSFRGVVELEVRGWEVAREAGVGF